MSTRRCGPASYTITPQSDQMKWVKYQWVVQVSSSALSVWTAALIALPTSPVKYLPAPSQAWCISRGYSW